MVSPSVTICLLLHERAPPDPLRDYLTFLSAPPYRLWDGAGPIDLVLLEVHGQVPEGLDRLKAALAEHPETPIVVLAEEVPRDFVRAARGHGAQDCVGAAGLEQAIEQVLERQRLRASEACFRALIDQSSDAVLILDRECFIRFANPAARTLLGSAEAQLLGTPFSFSATAGTTTEIRLARPDGPTLVAEMRVGATHWEGAQALLVTLRDVTEHRRLLDDLERARQRDHHRAHHDPLTGLPNRHLLLDRLAGAIAPLKPPERVAVFFLDLDGFKQINDTLGHPAGDEVLREAATRLQSCVRGSDTVARLGGDEFVLVLPAVEPDFDAAGVARKVRRQLTRPFEVGGRRLKISASIGISLAPGDGLDADTLIRKADSAMYRAKRLGKNSVQFYDASLDDSPTALVLPGRLPAGSPRGLSRLWQALQREELRLHYQPQFDLRTGSVAGVEALLRWRHPQRGLLRPGEFMPLVEGTDLAEAIDRWVMATACAQNRAWQEAGLDPVRMAVNLTPEHLHDGRLAGVVAEILARAGLEACWLGLELAEGPALNGPVTAATLTELQRLGVRVTIDDFGSGLGSLTALKRLPVDGVKIDRSVITTLPVDGASAAITQAVVELAHRLSLRVLATGVENDRQLAFLRTVRCDAVQGFHCGRPQTQAALAGLLRRALLRVPVPS
jgi:diguanylate cyclase (GGDEF)-like protein